MNPLLLSLLTIIVRRLLEPSTWAGLAGLWSQLGMNPAPFESIGSIVITVLSGVAVLMPEELAQRFGLRRPKPQAAGSPEGPGA
jgi:hypothetical protein